MKKLGQSVLKKLRSKAGESISETLVSLLIASLALVMLAGAVSSATGMITRSREKLEKYYDNNDKLVTVSESSPSQITIKAVGLTDQIVQIQYTQNTEFGSHSVVSYILDNN